MTSIHPSTYLYSRPHRPLLFLRIIETQTRAEDKTQRERERWESEKGVDRERFARNEYFISAKHTNNLQTHTDSVCWTTRFSNMLALRAEHKRFLNLKTTTQSAHRQTCVTKILCKYTVMRGKLLLLLPQSAPSHHATDVREGAL